MTKNYIVTMIGGAGKTLPRIMSFMLGKKGCEGELLNNHKRKSLEGKRTFFML